MASCFFLLRQFEDVLVYLKSIKPVCPEPVDWWRRGVSAWLQACIPVGLVVPHLGTAFFLFSAALLVLPKWQKTRLG